MAVRFWRCVVVVVAAWAVYEVIRFHAPTCRNCNIVLISVDTLRADHLGCYGYRRATSPAIDRLAQRSTRFANAYSASAWTLPGHMAMLSGRYPVADAELNFMRHGSFSDSYEMMPEVLHDAGYGTTALVGGGYLGGGLGFAQGFDSFTRPGRNLRDMGRALVRWLDRRAPGPFFLLLHGYDVHEPYEPPDDLRFQFIDAVPPACSGVTLRCTLDDLACRRGPGGRDYLISQYDALIVGVDRFIDTLINELDRRGLAERTIIALTADHGERLMDGGGELCGHMGDLDETVFRVPLVIYIPGMIGRTVAERVSLVDLAPTLLDLVGLPPPRTSHGASLIPLLEGDARPRPLYGVTGNDPGNYVLGVIDGDWKLVQSRANRSGEWTVELFDLQRDPHGTADVLPDRGPPPPQYFDLTEKLARWQQDIGFAIDGAAPATRATLPDEVVEQLRELGYEH